MSDTPYTLNTRFARAQHVFPDCLAYAQRRLSDEAVRAWVAAADRIAKLGRGEEPVLVFLEEMPRVAARIGEETIAEVEGFTLKLARSPNSRAIVPFLQSLSAAAKGLESRELFSDYLQLVQSILDRTTPKVHGIDSMYASHCLPEFLASVPRLLSNISLAGVKNWAEYGIQGYLNDPDRQRDYFALRSPDGLAMMQRERRGTLFIDHQRKLEMYLRALWQGDMMFVPYSLDYDILRKPIPYLDERGIHLPDVYEDYEFSFSPPQGERPLSPPLQGEGEGGDGGHLQTQKNQVGESEQTPIPTPALPLKGRGFSVEGKVLGIDRYRAVISHLLAHHRWSSKQVADNFSPFQRLSIELFEDARVEWLAAQEYPGLRRLWQALHPIPAEDACPEGYSSIRHRLAMMSRALLDENHPYQNPAICEFADRFRAAMNAGETSTQSMVQIGLDFITRTRQQSDLAAKIWFTDTEVSYRDDNRLLWQYIEEGDEEEYDARPDEQKQEGPAEGEMPPRLYPEWEHKSKHYLHDWVSLYEHLHPRGNAADIDRLLQKHAALAKQLKKIIDLVKPQQKVRVRYQEDGSELDLDVALRSLIDFKSGSQPDPRINMSHKNDGRSVAVSLLLDLSASLGDIPAGCEQSKLELSREAVSLLAWAVEQMGDPFAIGGFHSDTRHDVRYLHIKGYSEHWDAQVKSRLAAMDAGYSTRMGAALRHAGHYLSHQQADKRLLLVLTDGEPADIDMVDDPRALIEDARIAVRELDSKGIYTYCINLDPAADDYVADIFGKRYAVIDNVARLPERLPQLFMALTR